LAPRLLILETSGKIGQVALAEGGDLREVRLLDEARRHARDLAPTVAELLANQKWLPRQLDGVIVSCGPGSYTGLRVGIISAKTLAYATGCALIAVPTFQAICRQTPAGIQLVDVLADAQQEKVYRQRFALGAGGEWQPVTELGILTLTQWQAERSEESWTTGPGLHVYSNRLPPEVKRLDADRWDPSAESVLRIGLERLQRGERDDWRNLEPIYARPSSAEEKWDAIGTSGTKTS
jgi:tRNA threonylcarbamoyladenosine biosynthesis protein TsaB